MLLQLLLLLNKLYSLATIEHYHNKYLVSGSINNVDHAVIAKARAYFNFIHDKRQNECDDLNQISESNKGFFNIFMYEPENYFLFGLSAVFFFGFSQIKNVINPRFIIKHIYFMHCDQDDGMLSQFLLNRPVVNRSMVCYTEKNILAVPAKWKIANI
jgi:hypothetical protein